MAETYTKEKKSIKKTYLLAVGRRKDAVARVRMYPTGPKVTINGNEYERGDVIVNGKTISEYFRFRAYAPLYMKVFTDTDTHGKFVFSIKVRGGGLAGQLDAVILGIARVLEKHDKEKYRPVLKSNGYMTRDARIRERRKVGTGGKARRKKQSPKR